MHRLLDAEWPSPAEKGIPGARKSETWPASRTGKLALRQTKIDTRTASRVRPRSVNPDRLAGPRRDQPIERGTAGMEEQYQLSGNCGSAAGALRSLCAGCRAQVSIHVAHRTVASNDGGRGGITYADTDIVV